MMHEEMTKTVLAEMLAERDMPAAIPYVRGVLEGVNMDASKLLRRIEDTHAPHPGDEGRGDGRIVR